MTHQTEDSESDLSLSRYERMYREYMKELEKNVEKGPLRLGRRESEPHSYEVGYMHDVLKTNFPQHRCLLDLHHYFVLEGEKVNIQFDISLFLNFELPEAMPSYKAQKYGNRLPDLAINVLSKSTWKNDLSEIQESAI